VLVGLLIGEGHFGGDGRQPHITLRMHARHQPLFDWIDQTFPGGKLYGPYDHGGRHYMQWMGRGSYLRDVLVPLLDQYLSAELDAQTSQRYDEMKARYHRRLGLPAPARLEGSRDGPGGPPPETTGELTGELETSLKKHRQDDEAQTEQDGLTAAEIFDRIRRGRPA
jgi:hypothetical protein